MVAVHWGQKWLLRAIRLAQALAEVIEIRMENNTRMAVSTHLVAERETTSKAINALFVMQFGDLFFPPGKMLYEIIVLHIFQEETSNTV